MKVLAPFLSVVIHGLLGTCSMFSKKLFAFQVFVGFEKVLFEKFLGDSCISPQECMKYLFENFLKVSV